MCSRTLKHIDTKSNAIAVNCCLQAKCNCIYFSQPLDGDSNARINFDSIYSSLILVKGSFII